MTAAEFDVKIGQGGQGTLIVADDMLIRPAEPNPEYCDRGMHLDTARVAEILDLGDKEEGFYPTWHIVSRFYDLDMLSIELDRIFYMYVHEYCMSKTWVRARVNYMASDGEVQIHKSYGVEDGNSDLVFQVYCGIAEEEAENFIAALANKLVKESSRVVVVRPDSSERGFSVQGLLGEGMCPGDCGWMIDSCKCPEIDYKDRPPWWSDD